MLDYLRFLEDLGLNYLYLPENDRLKVTFRYREELIEQISSGKIETSTAKVRINAIANFYREIIKWRLLDSTQLKKLPFEETVKYIHIVSKNGRDSTVIKTSHNLSIRKPKKGGFKAGSSSGVARLIGPGFALKVALQGGGGR